MSLEIKRYKLKDSVSEEDIRQLNINFDYVTTREVYPTGIALNNELCYNLCGYYIPESFVELN